MISHPMPRPPRNEGKSEERSKSDASTPPPRRCSLPLSKTLAEEHGEERRGGGRRRGHGERDRLRAAHGGDHGILGPGETMKCDPPGEFYYHISQIALEPGELNENVQVLVEVDGKRILLGTLSVELRPQLSIDLVFEKEFELLHTSKIYSDESDEEVPLAIPLFPNSDDDKIKEAQNSPSKFTTLKSAAAASPIPEAIVEERKKYGKSKADDDDSDDESDASGEDESDDDEDMIDKQDSSDDDDGESSDEEETPSNNTKGTNRPVETPLNTPPQKKARLATPIMDSKAGTGKRSGYAKKRTANNDMSEHSAGYACKSCNKTFNTSMGLEAHSKAKHTATK
uniref:C2H2-type domain-containing protein n=1 Tax=Oryza punctata TaxID=4537 RepID=A0A0E0JSJ1_ORYPU